MRAIKIDPRDRSVQAVDTPADLDSMYALMECDIIEAVHLGGGQVLWLDEEGLLRKEVKPFFAFKGYEDKPFCGIGLITGTADGDNIDTTLSVQSVYEKIAWPDIEYVGMERSEGTVVIGGETFTQLTKKPIFRPKVIN